MAAVILSVSHILSNMALGLHSISHLQDSKMSSTEHTAAFGPCYPDQSSTTQKLSHTRWAQLQSY